MVNRCIIYGLFNKCEVKMFFCVFMDRDEVEVHKLAKKRTKPIFSHIDRTNLANKGFGEIFLAGYSG